ncbi:hypothetical protein [Luteimonas aquatica]|uniref:hypothetical protein n=1 Tax=Luteimonas aquatica TaxID=450364 RepID=UPI001F5A40EA|nr:hypothetical protein [Luteimonas aquatica]
MLKSIRAAACALALAAASAPAPATTPATSQNEAPSADLAQLSAVLEGKAPARRPLSFDGQETPYEACFRLCKEYWQEECPQIGRENCEEGYQRCYENCWW